MSASGVIFFCLGLILAAYVSIKGKNTLTRIMPIILYAWHTGICFYFYSGTLTDADPDSLRYFAVAQFPMDFGVGTDFIFWLTSRINSLIELVLLPPTYLDFFMLFNIFGYAGILILFKILEDIAKPVGGKLLLHRLAIAFIPGLSFWTSSLGKDSLVLLGISIVLYGAMAIQRRLVLLCLGLILVTLIRPQIAVMFGGALAIQFLMMRNINPLLRVIFGCACAAAVIGSLPFLAQFANLSSLGADVFNSAVEANRKGNMIGGGAIDTSNYNILTSMFAYMFRPLFIDADGGLGYALSAENVLLLSLVGVPLFLSWREWPAVLKQPVFIFNLAYFVVSLTMAGLSLSNFGIAARQKMMIVPSMMIIVTYLWVSRLYRAGALAQLKAAARSSPGQLFAPSPLPPERQALAFPPLRDR